MNSLLQANIFFFISSLVVVIFAAAVVVVSIYVVRVLKDVKKITEMASREGEKFVRDIETFREAVKVESTKVRTIAGFFIDLFHRKKTAKKNQGTKV